jgi:hypothetical protein
MAVDPNWKPAGTLTGDGLKLTADDWGVWRELYRKLIPIAPFTRSITGIVEEPPTKQENPSD